jgi:hypothetical protein
MGSTHRISWNGKIETRITEETHNARKLYKTITHIIWNWKTPGKVKLMLYILYYMIYRNTRKVDEIKDTMDG